MRAVTDPSVYKRLSTLPLVHELRTDGAVEHTRLICGFLGCDERPYNPLLTALPTVIHLPATAADASAQSLGRDAGNRAAA
jgi:hypothetical protein